jgi:hypothetical protein
VVKLTYIHGFSNWGPVDAEGLFEFSFAEAYARVDVKRLPPQAGYVYEGWLINAEGLAFFVGAIPVDSSGVGVLQTKLAGLSRYDYNAFVVAGRPSGVAAGSVPERFSIAARFAAVKDVTAASAPGDVRPVALPDTGERPPMGLGERILRTGGVMVVVAISAGLGVRFLHRKRSAA